MKRRLITSALPYVNNIPHLGNLIQVLSADVFARFCRQYGYETLYVCGTDEYGTATETKALEEGVTPRELCDRFHKIHADIYKWFNIDFDYFGRTSTPEQTEIVQGLFKKIDEAGLINEKTIEQLYCNSCKRFLADRYVHGTCPHCDSTNARGDQCEDCGKLLEPTELVAPRCGTCGATPEVKSTAHLYIDLPAVLPKLEAWMEEASVDGFWARNAIQMTKSWIRDGLKERAITRDLKWGIPVPKEGFENKVFYVWFDAPIGYISISACHTPQWKSWWQNPENVKLFQFIGKDNIPFHTVIFPSTLLGSGENWTMLHHMSSSEYLNYENTKFSKSKGIGVFGNDCQDTGIPADVWRFYIFYNRPEKSDTQFTWKDFQEKVNSELIGNLGNLINRTLTFTNRFFEGKIPQGTVDEAFWKEVKEREAIITDKLNRAELRDAFKEILQLSSLGNKAFQEGEPWRTRKDDPEAAASLLMNLLYLVRDLAILVHPYLPETSDRIAEQLGLKDLKWENLCEMKGIDSIGDPEILFQKMEDDFVDAQILRFAGSQADRAAADEEDSIESKFRTTIDLRVAKIIKAEQHPDAEKLYVITLDAGEAENRTICSGLVGHYSIDELTGKNIILAFNLKPAKLRGIKSNGMLLAAENKDHMEVLFPAQGQPGDRVLLAGDSENMAAPSQKIKIDRFFEIPIQVSDHKVQVGDTVLQIGGQPVKTEKVIDGEVG
ncbi:methionine--tRNA ligase [Oceanispirochaeta crateris]|uniref:Methionine--tRNA ligase n=1 Tax=Oceanispirochaeta crateris TaxID=2518645 RepID=A0A5C1QLK8_9SPIO|nr:methionine--tRNA ligase [Oceanispirochaeta crateris]QEN07042.1 methionine--tRNA ligase [Oceanispirochaeta crateris]